MLYKKINEILNDIPIDERIKPLISTYFVGKAELMGLFNEEMIYKQIITLCERIKNIEFLDTDKLSVAYEKEASVLSINKKYFKENNSEKIIPSIFAKFEEALDDTKQTDYNYIQNYERASQIVQQLNLPLSTEHQALSTIVDICFSNNKSEIQNYLRTDDNVRVIIQNLNKNINEILINGDFNQEKIIDAYRLLWVKYFDQKNSNINVANAENQQDVVNISNAHELLPKKENNKKSLLNGPDDILKDIKRITETSEKQISSQSEQHYIGDNYLLKEKIEKLVNIEPPQLTNELIEDKLTAMLEDKPEWDSRIKKLIIPFFTRSAKIYNWSYDQFIERANEINIKINKINFEPLGIMSAGDTAIDSIKLNSIMYTNLKGQLSSDPTSTLFHELGHNTDECNREKINVRKKAGPALSGFFYEWMNTVFERVSTGKMYSDESAMFLNCSGYEWLQYSGSMISSAMGVPEIEFVRLKDQGLEAANQFFYKNVPNETNQNPLNKLNHLFEKIKPTFSIFDLKIKRKNQPYLDKIYNYSISLIKQRIENDLANGNIENIEEYKLMQSYYLKKINENHIKSCKENGQLFKKPILVHDLGYVNDNISNQQVQIIGSKLIAESDFGFHPEELEPYINNYKSQDKSIFDKLKVKKLPRLPEPQSMPKNEEKHISMDENTK